MMKTSTSGLTPSAPPKLDLDAVLDCAFGNYPWDNWHRHALARGLDAELAGLGRLLVREAFNHGWESWLQSLCGWSDDGGGEEVESAVAAAWDLARERSRTSDRLGGVPDPG
jgi:hypothetical protein